MPRPLVPTTLIIFAAAAVALFAMEPLAAAEPLSPGGGMHQQPPSPPSGIERLSPVPRSGIALPATGLAGPSDPSLSLPDSSPQLPGVSIAYRGTRYLVRAGQWYEQRGKDLVAVMPLAGVLVQELPAGYAMRWIGGVPYFYADGLYYVWRERPRRYEILQSPPTQEPASERDPRPETGRESPPQP